MDFALDLAFGWVLSGMDSLIRVFDDAGRFDEADRLTLVKQEIVKIKRDAQAPRD